MLYYASIFICYTFIPKKYRNKFHYRHTWQTKSFINDHISIYHISLSEVSFPHLFIGGCKLNLLSKNLLSKLEPTKSLWSCLGLCISLATNIVHFNYHTWRHLTISSMLTCFKIWSCWSFLLFYNNIQNNMQYYTLICINHQLRERNELSDNFSTVTCRSCLAFAILKIHLRAISPIEAIWQIWCT